MKISIKIGQNLKNNKMEAEKLLKAISLLSFTPIPFCNTYSMHTLRPNLGIFIKKVFKLKKFINFFLLYLKIRFFS